MRALAVALGGAFALLIAGCELGSHRADVAPTSSVRGPLVLPSVSPSASALPSASQLDATAGTPAVPRGAADPAASAPQLYVVTGFLDVLAAPNADSAVLGTIRAGGSVELLQPTEPMALGDSPACLEGWLAISPRGFVCAREGTTRDRADPAVQLLQEYRLAEHAVLPANYGISDIAPVYLRLPTWDEQVRAERGIEGHLRRLEALREAGEAARVAGRLPDPREERYRDRAGAAVPDKLRGGVFAPFAPQPIVPGSPVAGVLNDGAKVSWIGEFDSDERSWLLTPELLFVPRDKVKRAVVSGFHGLEIPPGAGVAFMGPRPEHPFQRAPGRNKFQPMSETWGPSEAVLLAEPAVRWTDDKFLEAREPGRFVRIDDVIVAHPTPAARWGLDANARWIEINGKTHVLLLHEGGDVTFATLVSVGRMDTPRGKYRVVSKHLTASVPFERPSGAVKAEMPQVMLLSDAPDVSPSVAMFAAWWITAWGIPHGGSGVGIAPLDARRLFDTSLPVLPEGWHSVQGEGTWVVLHD